ncbi:MAG TPA: exopolysaccharide biosynthesis polyprenyl glycosylphosphotransferase [Candidatus Binataceae bacterium]|nr:exopolysaccharide biosynthesis polyprenyl glycosylphosphotransferase [Candidatus Binataceae bacterium]
MSSLNFGRSAIAREAEQSVGSAPAIAPERPSEGDPWKGARAQKCLRLARYVVISISDITALLVSFVCGYVTWSHLVLGQPFETYVELLPLFCLFPVFYAAVGLYPGFGLGAVESIRRLAYSTSLSFLVLAAASFAFKADPRYSRITFVITWAAALALVPLSRSLTFGIAKRFLWWREPTLVFGTLPQIELTIRSVTSLDALGYEIVGAVCQDERMCGRLVRGVRILGNLKVVPELTTRGVTTMLAWDNPSVASELADIQEQIYQMLFIREEGRLPIERVQMRNLGGVLGIEFTNELLRRDNQIIKRSLDLVGAGMCLLIAAPIIAICGMIIKLASPGPMLFRQQREGLHGRRFAVWKLRTMRPDAEVRLGELLRADPKLLKEWQQNVKLSHDPRLIPVIGKWLRRFSLDELPQLWNVIVGDMSLVGPRPFPEYHLRLLSPDFKRFRSKVRPGLTGMWQVAVRSQGSVAEQERFDRYYIRNWSVWLDIYLLARTVTAVLTGRGAC